MDFQWDVGYNFWGRSCEQSRISTDCCPVIPDTWALKGTAFVYGFDNDNSISPVALAATDSGATIHGGSNLANEVSYRSSQPLSPPLTDVLIIVC